MDMTLRMVEYITVYLCSGDAVGKEKKEKQKYYVCIKNWETETGTKTDRERKTETGN